MDNNKKLRDKLNSPPTDLPEELGWAQMKEGISSKMEAAQAREQASQPSYNKRLLLMMALLIIMLLLIRMCWSGSAGTPEVAKQEPSFFTESSQSSDEEQGSKSFSNVREGNSGPYEPLITDQGNPLPGLKGNPSAVKQNNSGTGPLREKETVREAEINQNRRENKKGQELFGRDTDNQASIARTEWGEVAGGNPKENSGSDQTVITGRNLEKNLPQAATEGNSAEKGSKQEGVFQSDASGTENGGVENTAMNRDLAPNESEEGFMSLDSAGSVDEEGKGQGLKELLGLRDGSYAALDPLALIPTGRVTSGTSPWVEAPSVRVFEDNSLPRKPHRLLLSSGVSVWDPGYSNALPERAEFERSRLSFSTQFNYEYHTDNTFFFTTGLGIHRLESRFDWSTPLNDYKITLEDVIVEQVTDALRGDVEFIRGDVEVEADAERIVRHHNRTTLIQLPLGLGASRKLGPFDVSLVLGSSINILGNSRGRTLHEGLIVDLDPSNPNLFDSQWKVNGFAGLRMSYFLSKNWNVNLGVNYQKAITNWSVEENIQMRPQILTLDIGMGYRFQ